jgi:hypothetical protein
MGSTSAWPASRSWAVRSPTVLLKAAARVVADDTGRLGVPGVQISVSRSPASALALP